MNGEQEAMNRLEVVMDYFKMLSLYLLEMTAKSNGIFGLSPRELATGYKLSTTVKLYPCATFWMRSFRTPLELILCGRKNRRGIK
jgi:hypothetical protein